MLVKRKLIFDEMDKEEENKNLKTSKSCNEVNRNVVANSRPSFHDSFYSYIKSLDCRSICDFNFLKPIGEGAYGTVYKAEDRKSNELVAIKKYKKFVNSKSHPTLSSFYEIKALRKLRHTNIINLLDIALDEDNAGGTTKSLENLSLIFEFMNYDLAGLLRSGLFECKDDFIGSVMKQLMLGVNYCHINNILHRDIKTANILVNNRGAVKLADFGLARGNDYETKGILMNCNVATLWYRAPELIFGEKRYGPSIDIWSCGCVLGELYNKLAIFMSIDEAGQINVISRICGTADPKTWPNVNKLPFYKNYQTNKIFPRTLETIFNKLPKSSLQLLANMLVLNPNKRISAANALQSPWLANVNPDKIPLPKFPNQNCYVRTVGDCKKE